ncbi:MAG: RagB/SusD family nutrient uptake outer membrane protein [Cyclobacteriaceae bacterium]|nr:RagB/SusD family nutrient uptake outer membrane protein [Cyclobacteriaceae bacterium]
MKRIYTILLSVGLVAGSCTNLLDPNPVDLLTDDVVLNEAKDVPNVEIGLYSAFRPIIPSVVIAGDATSDMLIHNGTFSQFRELGNKQITSANASVTALWGSIYNTIYIANFILERLPTVEGVPTATRDRVMGSAHFLRGYAYFVALTTYGGVPMVTTTSIETNRNIARATESDILDLILDDYQDALGQLPQDPTSVAFAGEFAVRAAMAKYYLYTQDWVNAELFATQVITSNQYTLEADFSDLVLTDFTDEAIFEVGYTLADDPGTNGTIGLNNLFVGRREIIPSNQEVVALASIESGDRFASIVFDANLLGGSDNGWSVAKYGTADQDNNNVVVMRLGEIYLIRAEARAQQNKINGASGAQGDINMLRTRANAPTVGSVTQSQMLQLLEDERRYELAYEGHRWYDLVRTDRAKVVMPAFNANWKNTYELWPIPQREILNNPALVGNQNPGY